MDGWLPKLPKIPRLARLHYITLHRYIGIGMYLGEVFDLGMHEL